MLRRTACLLMLLTCCALLHAQPRNVDGLRQPRILILLDGSSSMLQPWEKTTRFGEAATIISSLIDSIYSVNAGVEFGLRVYGHQSPAQNNDCTDTRQEVGFSKNNAVQMALRLASLRPYGVSPIAYSLKEAADNDLVDEARNAYSIILITDGGESCGGDICATVKSLIARKIYFRPYIISLVNDAPLRGQYDCLGTYLPVIKDADRRRTVGTIVEAYRPLLSMPIMAVKTEPAGPKPTITTVKVPAFKPERSIVQALAVITPRGLFPVKGISRPFMRTQAVPAIPRIEKPAPELRTAMGTFKSDSAVKPVIPAIKRDTTTVKPPAVKRDTIARAVPPKRDPVKPVATIKPVVKPIVKPPVIPSKPREVTFTTETEDDKETTLAIAFTDGHGKFYSSTPQLQLLDATTGKLVKQFYRTVDPAGNPDPQVIPAGSYNLLVAGRANMLMRRVVVEPKKKNKITVKVTNGSLQFRYEGHPERPVTEFEAIVNIRFEPGPVLKQRCTAELEYPPGNYYIEVNTRPISRFNTDIDFGSITEIQIPEPGFVQITNATTMGNVGLFTQLGDKFVHFYDVRVSGNPDAQKVQLQPGSYEAHWVVGPATYTNKEHVQRFTVKSNVVTEVELR